MKSLLGAFGERAVAGVEHDAGADFAEQGDLNFEAGVESGGLGSLAGGVAADAGFAVGDRAGDKDGKAYADGFFVEEGELDREFIAGHEIADIVTEVVLLDFELFVGFVFHEVVGFAVDVGKLDLMDVEVGFLEFFAGIETGVHGLASDDVLDSHTVYHRSAAALVAEHALYDHWFSAVHKYDSGSEL